MQFYYHELNALAYHFNTTMQKLKRQYNISFYKGEGDLNWYNLKSNPCPFLDGTYKCTIYDLRPHTCRKYPIFLDRHKVILSGLEICAYTQEMKKAIVNTMFD